MKKRGVDFNVAMAEVRRKKREAERLEAFRKHPRQPKRIRWYASYPGVTLSGPYKTQLEAYAAHRLTREAAALANSVHPVGLVVWPDDRNPDEIIDSPTGRLETRESIAQRRRVSALLGDIKERRLK